MVEIGLLRPKGMDKFMIKVGKIVSIIQFSVHLRDIPKTMDARWLLMFENPK